MRLRALCPARLVSMKLYHKTLDRLAYKGTKVTLSHLLEQQEWHSTWGHQHHLPNLKVGATSWLGYNNGCITGPSSHSIFQQILTPNMCQAPFYFDAKATQILALTLSASLSVKHR